MPPKPAVPHKRDDEGRAEEPRRRTRDSPPDENRPPSEWGPRIPESPVPLTASARPWRSLPLDPEPPQATHFVVVESQPLPPHSLSPLEFGPSPVTVESAGDVPHLRFPNLIFKREDAPPLPDAKDVFITQSEWESIRATFSEATSLMFHYPYFVIIGQTPPSEPISIKGLIVEFYDKPEQYCLVPGQWGSPVVPDPLPRVPWTLRILPSPNELKAMTEELESALGIHILTLSFYLARFVIEVEEHEFDVSRLPAIIAGHHAYWGTRGNLWGFTEYASPRKISPDPETDIVDDSEYSPIHPGIKVSGRIRSTSCGVVVQNVNNGDLRLTVSVHGWNQAPGDRSVYHGNREIAEIIEYKPSSD